MSDWDGIAWWAGMAMGAAALVVISLALFRDRPRGRRRCPKCWYDMSQTSGMRCPECGRTQRKEKRFSRPRRRWRMAGIGAVVLLGGVGTMLMPSFRSEAWLAYTPTPVLRLLISAFPEDIAAVRQRYEQRVALASFSHWERTLLAYSLGASISKEVEEATGGSERGAPRQDVERMFIVLGNLDEDAGVALPALAQACHSPQTIDSAVKAHLALGELARPNIPALRNALVDADNAIERSNLLLVLLVLGERDQWLAEQATLLLNSTDDPQTKLDGVAALMIIGADAEDILPPIELVLAEGSSEERVLCVRLLGLLARSRDDAHIPIPSTMRIAPLLFRSARTGHFRQIRRAIPAAADLVRAVADDEDPDVRRHAQNVLAKLP